MAKIVKKSPAPLYLAAAVWAAWAVLAPLYAWWHFALAAAVSAAAWLGGRKLFPDKVLILPDPEPAPEPGTGACRAGGRRWPSSGRGRWPSCGGWTRTSRTPSSPPRSSTWRRSPARSSTSWPGSRPKLPQLRRFLNYYLPTTLKLLNAYDRMGAAGVAGANIDGTMGRIDAMMDKVVEAFDKQLDALFADEALDISTDITVLEQMLAQEGLGGMQHGTIG